MKVHVDYTYSINGRRIRLTPERWLHIVEGHEEMGGLSRKEKTVMAGFSLEQAIKLVPQLRKQPLKHLWMDYDNEADVLYISFERPQRVTDSDLADNGIIRRWRGHKLVGLTILNARKLRR